MNTRVIIGQTDDAVRPFFFGDTLTGSASNDGSAPELLDLELTFDVPSNRQRKWIATTLVHVDGGMPTWQAAWLDFLSIDGSPIQTMPLVAPFFPAQWSRDSAANLNGQAVTFGESGLAQLPSVRFLIKSVEQPGFSMSPLAEMSVLPQPIDFDFQRVRLRWPITTPTGFGFQFVTAAIGLAVFAI